MDLRERVVAACVAHFASPETWNYQQLADSILAIPGIANELDVKCADCGDSISDPLCGNCYAWRNSPG